MTNQAFRGVVRGGMVVLLEPETSTWPTTRASK